MKTIHDTLEQFRQTAQSDKTLLGNKFEHLMVNFLKTDQEYKFEEVWLWRDWADRPQQVE
jgi:predicted helicase